jgi:HK97 family phage major capsid protein
MSEQLKRYREELIGLFNRMEEIKRAADEAGGEWTAEQRTNFDAASERASQVEEKMRNIKADADRAARLADLDGIEERITGKERGEERKDPEGAYADAFYAYMRGEEISREQRQLLRTGHVSGQELRAQGVGTDSAGGYTVPSEFRRVLVETMKAYGGLLNLANVITTSTGAPLEWPTNDDTGNVGAILSENTQISEVDTTFGTRTIGAYTYTSNLVRVSWQLLQDSAFNLDQYLPRKLGERIGRAVSAHLIAGTGTGQPTGVSNGITIGKTGATGQTSTVTYDDLVDLEHSIDPAYRNGNTRYLMNDSTLRAIRKLKDTQGRPLWDPVPTGGFPATINGVPYTIDQGMPGMAANAISIIYGNFQAGYLVRQVRDVQMVRLGERYADFLQNGYFGFSRLDARPDDPAAIAAYKNSAT